MKGLSIVFLAGALAAGLGAVAYKIYKEKKAKCEEEPVYTDIEIICEEDSDNDSEPVSSEAEDTGSEE